MAGIGFQCRVLRRSCCSNLLKNFVNLLSVPAGEKKVVRCFPLILRFPREAAKSTVRVMVSCKFINGVVVAKTFIM